MEPLIAETKPAGAGQKHRLVVVDALRGLAAIAVVLFHARVYLWVGFRQAWHGAHDPGSLLAMATVPLSFGFLGVQLLFVLSGYCIHRRGARTLSRDADAELPLWPYFKRRVARIYPVYLAALALTWAVDTYTQRFPALIDQGTDSLRALLANCAALQGIVTPVFGSNIVFWTLSIEIHFYILYPILFYISRRFGPRAVLLGSILVSVIYALLVQFLHVGSGLPWNRGGHAIFVLYWFTWCSGFYLAEIEAGRARLPKNLWLGGVSGAIAAVLLGMRNLIALREIALALVFFAVVAWALSAKPVRMRQPLELLSRIGLFSYSLYAIHVPVLKLFQTVTMPNGVRFSSQWMVVAGSLVCLGAGWLFFELIECWSVNLRPFESLGLLQRKPAAAPLSTAANT